MEGGALVSHDVIASYAADAALDVASVAELVDGPRRHRGVRVSTEGEMLRLELHVLISWGSRVPDVGSAVQARVSDYLGRVAKPSAVTVDVVVEGVAPSDT